MGRKAKDRTSKRDTRPEDRAKPNEPLVQPPPPPSKYGPISVLPAYVDAAALRLKQGDLKPETIEQPYKPVLSFLQTLNESGEPAALTTLARLLRNYPMILHHPYVWGIFRNLYYLASPLEELNKYAESWLSELIKAWAEGMTFGWDVSITRPEAVSGGRGQKPELFPHLEETKGWHFTDKAHKERLAAREFCRRYEDLMARLKACVDWKAVRRRYRAGRSAAVYEVAERIGPVFERFKQECKISAEALSKGTLLAIARMGLEERKGGNPRHKIACALLATLPWHNIRGRSLNVSASLADSTLETLRKHGFLKSDSL